MSIRKYIAYLKTIETGSITHAAAQLGYTQSGISHMMQSLEDEVGFPLMVRSPATAPALRSVRRASPSCPSSRPSARTMKI